MSLQTLQQRWYVMLTFCGLFLSCSTEGGHAGQGRAGITKGPCALFSKGDTEAARKVGDEHWSRVEHMLGMLVL